VIRYPECTSRTDRAGIVQESRGGIAHDNRDLGSTVLAATFPDPACDREAVAASDDSVAGTMFQPGSPVLQSNKPTPSVQA
jgi:hypothetical protein